MDDHKRIERLERRVDRILSRLHTFQRKLNWLETFVRRFYENVFPDERRRRKAGPPAVDIDDSQWQVSPDLGNDDDGS
jgi:hypothetical protein